MKNYRTTLKDKFILIGLSLVMALLSFANSILYFYDLEMGSPTASLIVKIIDFPAIVVYFLLGTLYSLTNVGYSLILIFGFGGPIFFPIVSFFFWLFVFYLTYRITIYLFDRNENIFKRHVASLIFIVTIILPLLQIFF